MKGPSGVDDILKTFEEVRRVEIESLGRTPPPMNNVQPPTQQQPAMVAISELQSVASEEYSQAESTRSGLRGNGGRRGRRAAPVGNMVSLDV
jgi:hypothetical protein